MKVIRPRTKCLIIAVLAAWLLTGQDELATAQVTSSEEERLQILTDPEGLTKKLLKDKNQPPFEFFKSQIAPFDVLPYVKANHWFSLTFELRANEDDYDGFLVTEPVRLLGMPQEVFFRRDVRLLKRARPPRSSSDETGGRRPDSQTVRGRVGSSGSAPTRHAMAGEPVDASNASDARRGSEQGRDHQVYGVDSDVGRDSFLGGTRRRRDREDSLLLHGPADGAGHVIAVFPSFDMDHHQSCDLGQLSDRFSTPQQQYAMLDWLHWGGQLIISGGAGASFALYKDSFLGPYLPAEATGETVALRRRTSSRYHSRIRLRVTKKTSRSRATRSDRDCRMRHGEAD